MDLLLVLGAKIFGLSAFKWVFIGVIVIDMLVAIMQGFPAFLIGWALDIITVVVFFLLGVPVLPILIAFIIFNIINLFASAFYPLQFVCLVCNIIGMILYFIIF